MRRVTRLAACLTAVSTLGAGLIMPITAVADDATPAVQMTTTSANVRAAANTATADPIASFDFNSDPDDGAFASAQGDAKATVQGTADLVNGKDDDNGKAAQLGSGFWLNVTKSDGSALLNGLDDVTISYDSKAAATGGQWTVFAAPTAGAVNGSAPPTIGVLDRTDKIPCGTLSPTAAHPTSPPSTRTPVRRMLGSMSISSSPARPRSSMSIRSSWRAT
mgnify:CR=1 FL=1